jgi:hypothetical protein
MATETQQKKEAKALRKNKRKISTSTQKYLTFSEVKNDVVVMPDGSMRGVLLVSSVNFALKSEDEQSALVQGYVQFLNSFDFPMQIVVQSRRLRIDDYLNNIKDKEKKQTNELLRIQTGEYRRYVAELVKLGDIMTKRFYIVVPYHPLADTKKNFISRLFELVRPVGSLRISQERFNQNRRELMKRLGHVQAGLNSMGVLSITLDTQSLIELYYNTYNPNVSQSQPLVDINKLELDDII